MTKNVCAALPVRAYWTPPVIDSAYFSPCQNAVNENQIVFVGNATPSKGLTDLLPAYAELSAEFGSSRDLHLVVTTELARTSASKELRQMLDSLGALPAFSQISWLSIVPDMRNLLAESAIHVAPFRNTNGPSDYFISTLEAMAMGKVCIVSDLPGMAEVVRDGENGFAFRAGDWRDLGCALRRAISCDRTAIGERAREFVVETFGQSALNSVNCLYGVIDA
jgi:glycosyltransferase involved in cell wall biosynthesis